MRRWPQACQCEVWSSQPAHVGQTVCQPPRVELALRKPAPDPQPTMEKCRSAARVRGHTAPAGATNNQRPWLSEEPRPRAAPRGVVGVMGTSGAPRPGSRPVPRPRLCAPIRMMVERWRLALRGRQFVQVLGGGEGSRMQIASHVLPCAPALVTTVT